MRLETVAKNLTLKLRDSSPEQQRESSLVACRLALQTAPVNSPIGQETLEQLQHHGTLPLQRITELNTLADQLDDKYFELHDNERLIQVDSLHLFRQARIFSALSFASGGEPFVAAMESIYEASSAVSDRAIVFDAVLEFLNKSSGVRLGSKVAETIPKLSL